MMSSMLITCSFSCIAWHFKSRYSWFFHSLLELICFSRNFFCSFTSFRSLFSNPSFSPHFYSLWYSVWSWCSSRAINLEQPCIKSKFSFTMVISWSGELWAALAASCLIILTELDCLEEVSNPETLPSTLWMLSSSSSLYKIFTFYTFLKLNLALWAFFPEVMLLFLLSDPLRGIVSLFESICVSWVPASGFLADSTPLDSEDSWSSSKLFMETISVLLLP